AWRKKGDYDKALRDYDETLRLDPKFTTAYLNRGIVKFLQRNAAAVDDFQTAIDVETGNGSRTPYATIVAHFAARAAKDEARAKRFLEPTSATEKADWPMPVVEFLRGKLDAAALLAKADDDDKRTEARMCLGLDALLRDRTTEARDHFQWVAKNGKHTSTGYDISIAELKRLDAAGR
ncbi:MAG: hypothetical protein C0483_21950, partial [Pirellula sp.]|nr:hypothetical protein [Pirellula sp.]